MSGADAKKKEFFAALMGVGVPTLRELYLEIIGKVEDNKVRTELLDEFNESWGEYMYTRTAGRQMHQGKGGNLLEYGGHGYAIILLDFDVET